MATTSEHQTVRRIALVLEPAGVHPQAVEVALRLADTPGAQLTGIVLEDSNLLRAAAFPFAEEILTVGAKARPLDTEALRRRLSRQVLRLQEDIQAQASARGIAVSFHVARGPGLRPALELYGQSELVVLGRRQERFAGATPTRSVVLVVHDGEIPSSSLEPITGYVQGVLQLPVAPSAIERMAWSGAEALVRRARTLRPLFVVVHAPLLDPLTLEMLLERLRCPVLVVG